MSGIETFSLFRPLCFMSGIETFSLFRPLLTVLIVTET